MLRRFGLAVDVTEELAATPEGRAAAFDLLLDKAEGPFRGPRGGRYEPVGEPYGHMDAVLNPLADRRVRTFVASVNARYVRPKRDQ